jgi:segregation and condensation protein B
MDDLKNIIESLLFVAEEPVTIDQIRQILSIPDTRMIRQTLDELRQDHAQRQGAFSLHEVAGGYQFRTRPEYVPWIKRFLQPKPARLSKAALETLAIIAYRQPVIRSDVEQLRGVDCGGVLRMLLERKLIRVLGRKEIPGRPLIYATTKQFLQVFDLKNLKDLPTPKEIEALAQEPLLEADEQAESEGGTEIQVAPLAAADPQKEPGDKPDPVDETGGEESDTPGNEDSEPDQKGLDEGPQAS